MLTCKSWLRFRPVPLLDGREIQDFYLDHPSSQIWWLAPLIPACGTESVPVDDRGRARRHLATARIPNSLTLVIPRV